MVKKKQKNRIVEAYPGVSMISQIQIKGKEHPISIGGFSAEGGFYLREGFKLLKNKETKNLAGEKLTYFNFVKVPKVKGAHEKQILTQKRKEERWKKKREKELEKELNSLRKKK